MVGLTRPDKSGEPRALGGWRDARAEMMVGNSGNPANSGTHVTQRFAGNYSEDPARSGDSPGPNGWWALPRVHRETGTCGAYGGRAWWRRLGLLVSLRRGRQSGRGAGRWRAVIPARRTPRTPRTGARRRTTLNVRSPELPRDREDFSYREDFSLAESEFLTSCQKSSRSWRCAERPDVIRRHASAPMHHESLKLSDREDVGNASGPASVVLRRFGRRVIGT
jgi:hypothetical protein